MSEVWANSCVASIRERCSVLVPSIDRMRSPICNAPHLRERGGKKGTDREGFERRKAYHIYSKASQLSCKIQYGLFGTQVKSETLFVTGGLPHLSTTLACLILSMTMTCLFLYTAVARLTPRLAAGHFTISTSRGPEACCTDSERPRHTQH